MYITDEIGKEYQNWESTIENHNAYIITAPTGSGKTFFVLNELLEYEINRQRIVSTNEPWGILYLVNRKVLKMQLEEEINKIKYKKGALNLPIDVMTYQGLEKYIRNVMNSLFSNGAMNMTNEINSIKLYADSIVKSAKEIVDNINKDNIIDDKGLRSNINEIASNALLLNKFLPLLKVISKQYGRNISDAIFEKINFSNYTNFERGFNQDSRYLSSIEIKQSMYRYFICDEAHYFNHDAPFNTDTYLSYWWIISKMIYGWSITDISGQTKKYLPVVLYMSATPEELKENLERDTTDAVNCLYNIDYHYFGLVHNRKPKINDKVVSHKADYSYVKLHVINEINEIASLEELKRGKWLIFINDIERGNKLCKKIKEGFKKEKKNEVIFIDAGFRKKDDMSAVVEEIVTNESFNNRILISTSVMDNGVTIRDREMRNLIILADSRTEFIQMLGRKRVDGENANRMVNVYICRQSALFFSNRLNTFVNPLLRIAHECGKMSQEELQISLLNPKLSKYLSHILLSVCGILVINRYAIRHYELMKQMYSDMVEEMASDQDAFLKLQCKWIDKDYFELEHAIEEKDGRILPKYYQEIVGIMNNYIGKKLDVPMLKSLRHKMYGNKEEWGPFHEIFKKTAIGTEFVLKNVRLGEKMAKNTEHPNIYEWNKIFEYFDIPYFINSDKIVQKLEKNDM